MDRIDTLIAKIETIERFNEGAIDLVNPTIAMTGLFNNFIRYLLDCWVVEPVSEKEASGCAERVLFFIRRPEGLNSPSRTGIETIIRGGGERILPLLTVRYLMHNQHLPVEVTHMTSEWREFVSFYKHVLAALDVGLFSPSQNDQ